MERYTIRILYRDRENPEKIVGVVEGDGGGGRRGFVGKEGLWRILRFPDREVSPGQNISPRPGEDRGSGYVKEIFQIMSEER